MVEQIQHVYGPSPEPFKVKLERGQKGGYGWEISISGNDLASILDRIQAVDKTLRETYAPEAA